MFALNGVADVMVGVVARRSYALLQVRAATIQAVGSMCSILTPQQFETQLPRILTAMLALYKRDANHLPITMGLCQLLDVSIRDDSQVHFYINLLYLLFLLIYFQKESLLLL